MNPSENRFDYLIVKSARTREADQGTGVTLHVPGNTEADRGTDVNLHAVEMTGANRVMDFSPHVARDLLLDPRPIQGLRLDAAGIAPGRVRLRELTRRWF